ncbi:MAG: CinA family nicotinamide mononucleotide deamidase-related protein [Candidatus Sumerlaeia bacterium]|nr:CinA family nicotinamide mononucleotide deamidase-related protein [Candidatus Sumerlaeia bacterium]
MSAAPHRPTACVASSGSEILQGLYADTNAQRLSQLLLADGFLVQGHRAMPDDRAVLVAGLGEALRTHDLVVLTGGLGPTEDDLTRFAAEELYAAPLVFHEDAAEAIARRFRERGVPMPESNLVQARLPEGARVVPNANGTAPGFFMPPRAGLGAMLALPGPPREWPPMYADARTIDFVNHFPGRPRTHTHTIHIAFVPESRVNQLGADLFAARPDVDVTILAALGQIRLRLTGWAESEAAAEEAALAHAAAFRGRLEPDTIFGEGPPEWTLGEAVVRIAKERGWKVATAESVTGGLVAARLTDHGGASAAFAGAVVAYSFDVKSRQLGVDAAELAAHGAANAETAAAMARGARERLGADWAVSTTGVAGPDADTHGAPVGTVWFGLAGPSGDHAPVRRRQLGGRGLVREWAANQALEILRRAMLGLPG